MGPALYLLLGAMILVGPDRPPALLGDASSATYAAWLASTAIETEGSHNGVERQVCATARTRSLGWRPTVDPYLARTVARYGTASIVEKVRVTGCGRDHVQTLVVSRAEGPRFNVIRLSQGESVAPVRATWDATDAVAKEAWARADRYGCSVEDSLRMGDTRVLPSSVPGEWSEVWPVTVCGAPQNFLIRFKLKAPDEADATVERLP